MFYYYYYVDDVAHILVTNTIFGKILYSYNLIIIIQIIRLKEQTNNISRLAIVADVFFLLIGWLVD